MKTTKVKPYRKIRKSLDEEEAKRLLALAYSQRQNCIETLMEIKAHGMSPLIEALCRKSANEIVNENLSQIEWLDKRIEDLQRFLPNKVPIHKLLG